MNTTTQMRCPYCRHAYSKSISTNRSRDGDSSRRQRLCLKCGHNFVTYEITATEYAMLQAIRKVVDNFPLTNPRESAYSISDSEDGHGDTETSLP